MHYRTRYVTEDIWNNYYTMVALRTWEEAYPQYPAVADENSVIFLSSRSEILITEGIHWYRCTTANTSRLRKSLRYGRRRISRCINQLVADVVLFTAKTAVDSQLTVLHSLPSVNGEAKGRPSEGMSSGYASRLISSPFLIPVSDHVQCSQWHLSLFSDTLIVRVIITINVEVDNFWRVTACWARYRNSACPELS